MNIPTLTPSQSALVRLTLKLVGTAAAAHGATRLAAFANASDTIELVLGLSAAVYGVWLEYRANKPKAVQQRAADTLPPGTVLPATTDDHPVAQVMSPESATDFIRKQSTGQPPNPSGITTP